MPNRLGVRVMRASVAVLLCALSLIVATTASAAEYGAQGKDNLQSDGAVGEAEALMACFNAKHSPEPIRLGMYLRSNPSRSIRIHRVWWSKREHRLPVTFFTHSDLSRLKSVEAQCRGYPGGVITVAVWVPLIVGNGTSDPGQQRQQQQQGDGSGLDAAHVFALQNATARVEHLFNAIEGVDDGTAVAASQKQPRESCVLRVLLLYEIVEDDVMAALMPLNILRNAAMLAATTPLVAMADADMALNWGLSAKVLANATRVSELERRAVQDRVVWVIPIFDTDDKLPLTERMALAEAAVAAGPNPKARILEMWRNQSAVFPYGSRAFTPGHSPTDCERWSGTDSDYEVMYKEGYEPFFMGDRKALPPYDSRFRGYFRDKIVNVGYVASLGFRFRVLPDAWMVHRPHEPSMASYKWFWYHNIASNPTPLEKLVPLVNGTWVRARTANNFHSLSTYAEAAAAMANGTYRLVLNEATLHCRAVLPWWR